MERCARCGAEFTCGAGTGACWCGAVELSADAVAAAREFGDTCLCPACLAALTEAASAPNRITPWPPPPPSTR